MCIEKRMADTYRVSVIFLLLFTANVPGGVFPKGMLRDAKQNPELAGAKHCILSIIPIYLKCMISCLLYTSDAADD